MRDEVPVYRGSIRQKRTGDKVNPALDCRPGWMLPDAIKFARAVEKHNLMWLEDMLTGGYVPWVNPQAYRELTLSTSTPIHTGEQIYSRHNFKELIETQAVRVIGPDPADIGGMAELKWVAEHAHMHSILMAPHGTANGLLGLGALINVCATLDGLGDVTLHDLRRSWGSIGARGGMLQCCMLEWSIGMPIISCISGGISTASASPSYSEITSSRIAISTVWSARMPRLISLMTRLPPFASLL